MEPLAFVQIAITKEIPRKISTVLDDEYPTSEGSLAVFYSITATQRGLSGIDLASSLISRVIDHVKTKMPQVKQFCTLSPIPGFRGWLEMRLNDNKRPFLSPGEKEYLVKLRKDIQVEPVEIFKVRLLFLPVRQC
jgi:malonyl-CoA decarboxylase